MTKIKKSKCALCKKTFEEPENRENVFCSTNCETLFAKNAWIRREYRRLIE